MPHLSFTKNWKKKSHEGEPIKEMTTEKMTYWPSRARPASPYPLHLPPPDLLSVLPFSYKSPHSFIRWVSGQNAHRACWGGGGPAEKQQPWEERGRHCLKPAFRDAKCIPPISMLICFVTEEMDVWGGLGDAARISGRRLNEAVSSAALGDVTRRLLSETQHTYH